MSYLPGQELQGVIVFNLILSIHFVINPVNCQKRIPAEQCHMTVSLGSTRVRRSKGNDKTDKCL